MVSRGPPPVTVGLVPQDRLYSWCQSHFLSCPVVPLAVGGFGTTGPWGSPVTQECVRTVIAVLWVGCRPTCSRVSRPVPRGGGRGRRLEEPFPTGSPRPPYRGWSDSPGASAPRWGPFVEFLDECTGSSRKEPRTGVRGVRGATEPTVGVLCEGKSRVRRPVGHWGVGGEGGDVTGSFTPGGKGCVPAVQQVCPSLRYGSSICLSRLGSGGPSQLCSPSVQPLYATRRGRGSPM